MNIKKTSAILLATTLSLGTISSAFAVDQNTTNCEQSCKTEMGQKKNKGKGHHHKGMEFSKLDLTDAQKMKMKEIREAAQLDQKGKNSEEKMAHRTAMQALISADSFDEKAVKSLIEAQQSERAAQQLASLKVKNQMFQLLTDEQKAKFAETDMKSDKQKGKNRAKGKKHRGKNKQMAFAKLDLTDTQKEQIKAIMDPIQEAKKAKRDTNSESKMAHRASMKALISADSFDEAAAKSLIETQQSERAEQQLVTLKAKHQAFQLLTDEQKAKYSELKADAKNKANKHRCNKR